MKDVDVGWTSPKEWLNFKSDSSEKLKFSERMRKAFACVALAGAIFHATRLSDEVFCSHSKDIQRKFLISRSQMNIQTHVFIWSCAFAKLFSCILLRECFLSIYLEYNHKKLFVHFVLELHEYRKMSLTAENCMKNHNILLFSPILNKRNV